MAETQTLEHVILGPGNFEENISTLDKMHSIVEIQKLKQTNPKMQNERYYGADVAAYDIQNGNNILQLYNLNNIANFTEDKEFDKADFISKLRGKENKYFKKLSNLEDEALKINLSDKKLNNHVQRDINFYSYITYNMSDVVKGKKHFEDVYGKEATKLFTAMHGEEVYSEEGIKGKFKKGLSQTRIYFVNKNIVEDALQNKVEGTKYLRAAYLSRLDFDSVVHLDNRFDYDYARVSGVVGNVAEGDVLQKITDLYATGKKEYKNKALSMMNERKAKTLLKEITIKTQLVNEFYQKKQ